MAAEEEPTGDLDVLDVLEAMGGQFHEHHDVMVRWPWRLFCAKWVRMMRAAAKERQRQADQQAEHEWEKLRGEHDKRVKGGW